MFRGCYIPPSEGAPTHAYITSPLPHFSAVPYCFPTLTYPIPILPTIQLQLLTCSRYSSPPLHRAHSLWPSPAPIISSIALPSSRWSTPPVPRSQTLSRVGYSLSATRARRRGMIHTWTRTHFKTLTEMSPLPATDEVRSASVVPTYATTNGSYITGFVTSYEGFPEQEVPYLVMLSRPLGKYHYDKVSLATWCGDATAKNGPLSLSPKEQVHPVGDWVEPSRLTSPGKMMESIVR